jgi:thiosulfate/3-mercaptopyruvate sulfurtransferase
MRRAILAAFTAAVLGMAQSGDPGMLVTGGWLEARLNEADLVILHAGTEKDYAAGHIPGARLITLGDISRTGENGLRLELPDAQSLAAAFGQLGVRARSRVVVYAGGDAMQAATRVWFTLDSMGLGSRASVLDGGLALWKEEGRSVTTNVPATAPAALEVTAPKNAVVDFEWVKAHLRDPKTAIIDARTPEFYSGANPGAMPRAGRIPGARSVPYTSLFDGKRRLLPRDALREKMGGDPSQLRLIYCHIGLQATVPYFVARYLGYDVRLYDGSFQDWSARAELPVETGVGK